ncbi:MAG: FAD-dependent oxidoreductase [bacterium]|nr:FAD-dependent oxidoreductase [bacterium]
MNSKQKILILGAGVSGLSTAILLLKKGYSVMIWAKDLPPNTTSNKAAAIWYPYLCYPRNKAIPWAKTTFEYFQNEIMVDPNSGCIARTFTEMFDKLQPAPWWKDAFPGKIERPVKKELPKGYIDGYRIQSIVIDTSLYMKYLMNSFKSLGGEIIQKEIKDIQKALAEYRLVINCTGLGSKELFNDDKIYPVRGQMVKIKATGFDQAIVDSEGPNTLSLEVPRINDIMLGGTAQVNNWNIEVDPRDTEEILRKIALIAPGLKNIEIINESVGLRPARESIRLETEKFGDKTVIHNYGHGGAGFTLSWGCAQDVVGLVDKAFSSL